MIFLPIDRAVCLMEKYDSGCKSFSEASLRSLRCNEHEVGVADMEDFENNLNEGIIQFYTLRRRNSLSRSEGRIIIENRFALKRKSFGKVKENPCN